MLLKYVQRMMSTPHDLVNNPFPSDSTVNIELNMNAIIVNISLMHLIFVYFFDISLVYSVKLYSICFVMLC